MGLGFSTVVVNLLGSWIRFLSSSGGAYEFRNPTQVADRDKTCVGVVATELVVTANRAFYRR